MRRSLGGGTGDLRVSKVPRIAQASRLARIVCGVPEGAVKPAPLKRPPVRDHVSWDDVESGCTTVNASMRRRLERGVS